MTYTAPRQGLFAIIVLISLSLNLLFFVISQEQQMTKINNELATKNTILLSDELSAPLGVGDRVSISVIANRHVNAGNISFIGVYDSADNLIVPVGQESESGFVTEEMIANNGNILGRVIVHTDSVQRSEIFLGHWLYILSIFVLHGMLWLFYSNLGRPTKELLHNIAMDVRRTLLNAGVLSDTPPEKPAPKKSTENETPIIKPAQPLFDTIKSTSEPKVDIATKMEEYLVHHEDEPVANTETKEKPSKITIQIRFDDPHHLLNTVSPHSKNAYFKLCNQLTARAVDELLAQPILTGVQVKSITAFNEKGSQIVLIGQNDYAKTPLASVLLARLMLMLNQIVYDKHRELKRFALPIRTFVSEPAKVDEMIAIAKKHKDNPLVWLPNSTIFAMSSYAMFAKLDNPITVGERECRYLKELSESNVERLQKVRDKVLLSNH